MRDESECTVARCLDPFKNGCQARGCPAASHLASYKVCLSSPVLDMVRWTVSGLWLSQAGREALAASAHCGVPLAGRAIFASGAPP